MKRIVDFLRGIMGDSLYGNSMILIMDSAILVGFGFLFWTIVARLFPPEQVGIATSLLVATELLAVLSLVGLDIALIHYLPKHPDRRGLVQSSMTVVFILAAIIGLIFLLLTSFILPKLAFVSEDLFHAVLFILFVISNAWYLMFNAIFIAMRKATYVMIKDTVFSVLKTAFPILLVAFGAYGIFSSWMTAMGISVLVSAALLSYKLQFQINGNHLKEMVHFSLGNYFANIFIIAPGLLLPLIITQMLSPGWTAYFYVAWMIASMLFVIPAATSKTLLAHGSYDLSKLKKDVRRAFWFSLALLLPGIVVISVIAGPILSLFGHEYSEHAAAPLRLLALSSIPFVFNSIFSTVMNAHRRVRIVTLLQLAIAGVSIALSFFVVHNGILAVALVWLITQTAAAIVTGAWMVRYAK